MYSTGPVRSFAFWPLQFVSSVSQLWIWSKDKNTIFYNDMHFFPTFPVIDWIFINTINIMLLSILCLRNQTYDMQSPSTKAYVIYHRADLSSACLVSHFYFLPFTTFSSDFNSINTIVIFRYENLSSIAISFLCF